MVATAPLWVRFFQIVCPHLAVSQEKFSQPSHITVLGNSAVAYQAAAIERATTWGVTVTPFSHDTIVRSAGRLVCRGLRNWGRVTKGKGMATSWFKWSRRKAEPPESTGWSASVDWTPQPTPRRSFSPPVPSLQASLAPISPPTLAMVASGQGQDASPAGQDGINLVTSSAVPDSAQHVSNADLSMAMVHPAPPVPAVLPEGSGPGVRLTVNGLVRTRRGQPRGGAAITVIDPAGDEVIRSVTDDNGCFEVSDLLGGTYTVVAICLPYRPAAALIAGLAGHAAIELVLHGTGTIRGRLVAGPGRSPVEGRKVRLIHEEDASPLPDTTTDGRGFYHFDDVPEGPWSIVADCPGYRAVRVDVDVAVGSDIEQEMLLVPLGRVRGRVVADDGTPVSAIRLSLVRSDGHLVAAATTDKDGWYEFSDLEAASYVVVCLTVEPEPDLLTVGSGQTVEYSVRVATVASA